MIRRRLVAHLVGVLVAVAVLASCVGRTRYDEVDGPLRESVVFPSKFGIDVRGLPIDVPAAMRAVQVNRLLSDVAAIDEPRGLSEPAGALRAAAYISSQLTAAGYSPRFDKVTHPSGAVMPNVIADLPGTHCAATTFVIGAHYDTVTGTPGADDNASGVAGLLELARVLRSRRLPMTIRFIGFAFEETGLQGSRKAATDLAGGNVDVAGMVSLEMIGFTRSGEDSFLGVPNDYLATVADPNSAYLARVFGAAHYEYLLNRFAPAAVIDPAVIPDIRRSDNAAFWDAGFRALLVTDTANFRNPNYHTASDTIGTLDFGFLADSTRATLVGALAFGLVDADDDGTPDVCS